ncbi:hypothetical protein MLD38_039402 [Melastoma candidum]|uniref:Uncharacterized protein n=1 Tax=Melastoma candidum TaxID=119954 RepID=A0ACB9L311_9MYRT|nr:hypothetical protein MLD38_039402 [Melastoma candidum]
MPADDFPTPSDTMITQVDLHLPQPDILILTSAGTRIPAHTGVLASVSPVLDRLIFRRSLQKLVPILGVPCEAVLAFVKFIYSSGEEHMEKYVIHLLTLGHVYMIPDLKRRCIEELAPSLTAENVIDVLQLSRLCNAPDLYLRCMKLVHRCMDEVEGSEGWRFLQLHDPWLELEILRFIDEEESRKTRSRRHREEQHIYLQLCEAMECLEHMCTLGCMTVGPKEEEHPTTTTGEDRKKQCSSYATCQGMHHLIRHFVNCARRSKGGCIGCKRMGQLLRLHSEICDQSGSCKIPLCRQFKWKAKVERRKDEVQWKMLGRKVLSAKATYFLSNNIRPLPRECIYRMEPEKVNEELFSYAMCKE